MDKLKEMMRLFIALTPKERQEVLRILREMLRNKKD